jgi:hypothetical protein
VREGKFFVVKTKTFTPVKRRMKAKRHSAIPTQTGGGAGLILLFDGEVAVRTRARHDERNPAGILTWSMTSLPPSRFFNQWLQPAAAFADAVGVCIS